MSHSKRVKETIIQVGDPVLRTKAKNVLRKDIGTAMVNKVINAMKKALAKEEYGVAIAAPQIGHSLRIFVVSGKVFEDPEEKPIDADAPKKAAHPDRVFVNPELTRLSRKKAEMSEGCLSVRGKYGTVMRHEKATLKALDEHGKSFIYHGSGLIGHIFQHECDHLDGILYIDKTIRLEEDEDMKSARVKLKEKHGV